jgi:hypothetical protein
MNRRLSNAPTPVLTSKITTAYSVVSTLAKGAALSILYSVFIATSLPSLVKADEVPPLLDEPIANRKLDFDAFENITQLLHAGRLAPHLKCELKVRSVKEDRHFTTGTRTVEVLEVAYYPRGLFSDKKVKLSIAAELATYGSRVTANAYSGAGEDIKIEAHDAGDHWLRFVHDGKGHLVYFVLGNNLTTYPCLSQ